jgi:hypothetical protein
MWTAQAVLAAGCHPPLTPRSAKPLVTAAPPAQPGAARPDGRAQVVIDSTAGEDGKLTATVAAAPAVSTDAVVTPLAEVDTQALLARMEPLPAVMNAAAPVMRPPSPPQPRAGTVQPIAFVAPTGNQVADKPLAPAAAALAALAPPQVLPIGEVDRESEIRVRFAEPMIAGAAVGSAARLPITIQPAIAGTWRWVDTRVAQFTAAAPRLPGATEFTVTVGAGLKAVSGATLASAVTATFATRPVTITGTYPTVALRPDSPIAVKFDQEVREAVGMAATTRMGSTLLNGLQLDKNQFRKDVDRMMKSESARPGQARPSPQPTR